MVNSTVFATVDTGLGMPVGFLSVMVAIQGVASVASGLAADAVIRRLGFERTIVAGSTLFAVGLACQTSTLMWVVLGGVVPFAAGIPLIVAAANPVLHGARVARPGAAGPTRIPAAVRPTATPVPEVAHADLAVAPGPTSD
ncbi:hypothetical protein [Arthrobacter sp. KK5.5]|uniref:hypothetical protein n=1 Tax=Arthrobacter sp. KK5.5 TaxID=3373084 RepID=UPI003EE62148